MRAISTLVITGVLFFAANAAHAQQLGDDIDVSQMTSDELIAHIKKTVRSAGLVYCDSVIELISQLYPARKPVADATDEELKDTSQAARDEMAKIDQDLLSVVNRTVHAYKLLTKGGTKAHTGKSTNYHFVHYIMSAKKKGGSPMICRMMLSKDGSRVALCRHDGIMIILYKAEDNSNGFFISHSHGEDEEVVVHHVRVEKDTKSKGTVQAVDNAIAYAKSVLNK